jgi:hypothetical protein
MTIETIIIFGSVAAATAVVAFVHERRMDVLHGPYIESRARLDTSARQLFARMSEMFDRMRWNSRNVVYLTSIIAC